MHFGPNVETEEVTRLILDPFSTDHSAEVTINTVGEK